jgi:hypothetical protein
MTPLTVTTIIFYIIGAILCLVAWFYKAKNSLQPMFVSYIYMTAAIFFLAGILCSAGQCVLDEKHRWDLIQHYQPR